MKRRIGRILVDLDLIDNRYLEIIEMLYCLKMVIYRAEVLYASRQIEYIGISPKFELLEPGFVTPLYSVTAVSELDAPGGYKYTVAKVDP